MVVSIARKSTSPFSTPIHRWITCCTDLKVLQPSTFICLHRSQSKQCVILWWMSVQNGKSFFFHRRTTMSPLDRPEIVWRASCLSTTLKLTKGHGFPMHLDFAHPMLMERLPSQLAPFANSSPFGKPQCANAIHDQRLQIH